MISAVKHLAEKQLDLRNEHLQVVKYLEACNMLFENGILSHTPILSASSTAITNMENGFKYFCEWKDNLSAQGIFFY